ncbi:NAD-dependent malic enzyme [Enteractinococcus fodinae]|uniref:Malate dehydrogenase (Oxaloacetate-decarboxylating) n=1 Tax=Enteractinococcus fodinae TaxID=684663 RepID=A0ABU2B187_9MICC|nr:NAD-dependent malic enzyme [Enteractinococcus fodinae]MDR7347362.1 malate dehydrogenase (oxaloacetate-decarboxylating) [Enteractinococcus fodinae]
MATPSPGYSIIVKVQAPSTFTATSDLTALVAEAGAAITALDIVDASHESNIINLACNTLGKVHSQQVRDAIEAQEGFKVLSLSDRTFHMHQGGKLQTVSKVNVRNRDDLSRAYTPGVARVCKAIAKDTARARELTIKRNTIAVVTDGTAVLGLGDIGPEASMPVMEGKAVLFKQFANVDAWPVALDTKDTDEIVAIVKALAPAYGGINLEDISAPRCFEIEARLREELDIPVFHDDQHGTAIVTQAALNNALKVVGKDIADVRIVVSGVGAAGHAIIRLLQASGAQHILAAGRDGVLEPNTTQRDEHRQWLADNTNQAGFSGSLKEAMVGADVFIGVSAPNLLDETDIASMNDDAIVFAMANPDPEILPTEASKHAAVVATGRSDFPNQINNVLAFPGLFRGLLDAGASDITEDMLVAAADAISETITEDELNPSYVIPSVFNTRVAPAVAEAVAEVAQRNGNAANLVTGTQDDIDF